jgi:beta-1,2-mannobiose phosphorylase / 1,2-beta-oligomannan phosphorylase
MDLAHRFTNNPLLVPGDLAPGIPGMNVECLLNPGVFRFKGRIWLLLRVAERPVQENGQISFPVMDGTGKIVIRTFQKDEPGLNLSDPRIIQHEEKYYLTTLSYLRMVCSDDGIHFHEPEGYPPLFGSGESESFGIEDCRVTQIEEHYHLTYTKVSSMGVGVGLISTTDWKNFERKGMIFAPHNKDCALFGERIHGRYFALHRPSSPEIGGNYIWIAESPDLIHWGNHKCLALTRKNDWDSVRIGAGASPIKTEGGWLVIYHGANHASRYCLGLLLLDLNDPSIVLARSVFPVMEPTMDYEKKGFYGNVVFTNGHLVDGDKITIYYGASDMVICGATFSLNELLNSLRDATKKNRT